MIEGYATSEGTERFMNSKSVAKGHFRVVNGLYLTSVGMGTYLGSPTSEEDQMIVDALKLSVETGMVNVVDTAINYRSQKSERAIGRAIKEMIESNAIKRDEIFVSTKNGYITDDGDLHMDIWEYVQSRLVKTGIIKPDDISSGYHCMTIPYLNDQLERSRRNLNLECIDLMYIHNAVEGQIQDVGKEKFMEMLERAFEFYEEKRREGKIRYYGMATWNCFRVMPDNKEYQSIQDTLKLAEKVGGKDHGFRFIQLPFNIVMREALVLRNQSVDGEMLNVIDAASRLGINIFTSVPLMQRKLLNDRFMPKFGNIQSVAVRCLQFARSANVIPLVGQKGIAHVQENSEIARIPPMSREEFYALLTAFKL